MTMWIAVLVAGVGSYLLRVTPLLLGDRVRLSERAQEGLRHAGMGGITALLVLGVVAVLRPGSGLPVVPVIAALGVAGVCAGLRRSMLTTVSAGAVAYGVAFLAATAVLGGI
jgi:branched-subunit amino acid transport protein